MKSVDLPIKPTLNSFYFIFIPYMNRDLQIFNLLNSDLLISKQEALFWAIKQAMEGLACLLACLLLIYS